MTDDGAYKPVLDDLVGQVRDLAYRQASPRLSADEVRWHGRRRRIRRGATAVGGGAIVVAGVFIATLLTGGHSPASVVHPTGVHTVSTATTVGPSPARPRASTVDPGPGPGPAEMGTPGVGMGGTGKGGTGNGGAAKPGAQSSPRTSASAAPDSAPGQR